MSPTAPIIRLAVFVFVYAVGVCSFPDDQPTLFGHLTDGLQPDFPGSLGRHGEARRGRQVVRRFHAVGKCEGTLYTYTGSAKCNLIHK